MKEVIGNAVGIAPSGNGIYLTVLIEGLTMSDAVNLFYDKLGAHGDTQVFEKKKVKIEVMK